MILSIGNRAAQLLLVFSVCLILVACSASAHHQAMRDSGDKDLDPGTLAKLEDKPEPLQAHYKAVLAGDPSSQVLYQMRLGLEAMGHGEYQIAANSFDVVLAHIESEFGTTEQAKQARRLWYEEGMKDFRGEPYERAMAYYYRGLLYLREADYQNARASFRSGVLQDAFAEELQYRADFALLMFLEGWASHLLGDTELARDSFEEARAHRPALPLPAADSDCLVIVETGTAPRKLADGVGQYQLKLFRGRGFEADKVALQRDGSWDNMFPIEDIAWQAKTRGGRPVDHILKGQAVLKGRVDDVGSTVADAGTTVTLLSPLLQGQMSEIRGGAAALSAVGLSSMLVAQRMNPRADTRTWDNLPDRVHLAMCDENEAELNVRFLNPRGAPIGSIQQVLLHMDRQGNRFGWIRSPETLAQ
ncbi:hypothetical protein [Ectothiorhodospira variabilis]|uniref:hypothetical protein n=1 Tax=Ectothiorhodospira variabilis TaxID=505694 RepID=UPI001EFBE2D7|nr:hypothetical protein [Ectothiorhodospira variabilis]MCG5498951.1 hypothetical protein [Ectothiorhodospira variabilis]